MLIKREKVIDRHTIAFCVIAAFGLLLGLTTILNVSTIKEDNSKVIDNSPRSDSKLKQEAVPNSAFKDIKPDYSFVNPDTSSAPVISNIPTKEPVVFLTIDDGEYKDQSVLNELENSKIKASLFLPKVFIDGHTDFFQRIVNNGSEVENHSLNHYLDLNKRSYQEQKDEICNENDYIEQHFGRRPIFFRPPGGAYDDDTKKAAAACGIKAIITWVAKANGGSMQYQIGDKLRPGDIVLMHFRSVFKQDLQAFIDAKNAAGLQTELLEDWIK
jgi:peptidoglycan/xylan/chitin deacetylase (PgdA/CDA1 family)